MPKLNKKILKENIELVLNNFGPILNPETLTI